jgi:hypothetical protein
MSNQYDADQKQSESTECLTPISRQAPRHSESQPFSSTTKESDSVELEIASLRSGSQSSQPSAEVSVRPGSSEIARVGRSMIEMMALTLMVNRRDDVDGCSYWEGSISASGYPVVSVMGLRAMPAHRLACALWSGPSAVIGKDVHHRCEHRSCVNPVHLVPLTPKEHMQVHAGDLECPPTIPTTELLWSKEVIAAVAKGGSRRGKAALS